MIFCEFLLVMLYELIDVCVLLLFVLWLFVCWYVLIRYMLVCFDSE